MRKFYIKVSLLLLLAGSFSLQSCIGSFSLTNKVLKWNKQVGSKFLNELVFFAFWILPVYEVTAVADLLVINSIEFWSGNNPVMEEYAKVITTNEGDFLISCNKEGYTIQSPDGQLVRIIFEEESRTWSISTNDGEILPFLTFIDDQTIKLITPSGEFKTFNVDQTGVWAYSAECMPAIFSDRNV